MSKSMAIEGVMKIFLMVAVIIVGMSFLLKAFGIDLMGWLENLLGGFGIPDDGKILYMKMDPADKEIFAFFITDDKIQEIEENHVLFGDKIHTYFLPDNLDDASCVIYIVKEVDLYAQDTGYYYYVENGALIQTDSCDSIGECIGSDPEDHRKGCIARNIDCPVHITPLDIDLNVCAPILTGQSVVGDCGCAGLALCVDSSEVKDEGFQSGYNFVDFCNPEKPTSKCNILVPGEYNIKYGLLCADGKWRTCSDKTEIKNYREPEVDSDCSYNGEIGTWSEPDTAPELVVSPSSFVSVINSPITIEIYASDERANSGLNEIIYEFPDVDNCFYSRNGIDLSLSDPPTPAICSGFTPCEDSISIMCLFEQRMQVTVTATDVSEKQDIYTFPLEWRNDIISLIPGCGTIGTPKEFSINLNQRTSQTNCGDVDYWKVTPTNYGTITVIMRDVGAIPGVYVYHDSTFNTIRSDIRLSCDRVDAGSQWVCDFSSDGSELYIKTDSDRTGVDTPIIFGLS